MVDKSHIFKLLVLKNKLAKFDRLGYFAANKKEAEAIVDSPEELAAYLLSANEP